MNDFSGRDIPAMPITCMGCGVTVTPPEAMDAGWDWWIDTDDPQKRKAPVCGDCQEIARFWP